VRADERTRTADLLQLRVIGQPLQGFAESCRSRIFEGVSFLCLTACCARGGIRVVSTEALLLHDPTPSCTHPKYAQHLTRDTIIQLALDRYSRWMPFLGCNTAEAIDEALG
jgi:hypothetical protein